MLALALFLVGAVGLELGAPPDLTPAEVDSLKRQITRALDAHKTARATMGENLRLTVDVGATRLQVVGERVQAGVVVARAAQVGPRDVELWWRSAVTLVDTLYGAPAAEPTAVQEAGALATTAPPPARPTPWGSWVLLGTGAAVLAASAGFALSSADATSEMNRGLVVDPELSELESRATTHGILSAVLAGTAVACAAAGVVWLASD